MQKTLFLKMAFLGLCACLFLLTACASGIVPTTNDPTSQPTAGTTPTAVPTTSVPTSQPTVGTTPTTAPTGSFAATVLSSGDPVNPAAQGSNLTTINAPSDRPVAIFTPPVLNIPAGAQGDVVIQNASSASLTLVSNTPDGFASFTIAHDSATTLVFHRTGTFVAHIQGYPPTTTLVIVITALSSN